MQLRLGSSTKGLVIASTALVIAGLANCSNKRGATPGSAGAAGEEPSGNAGAPATGAAGQAGYPTLDFAHLVYPPDAAPCQTFTPDAACPEYCLLIGPGLCVLRGCEEFTVDGCPPRGLCELMQTCSGDVACSGYFPPDCSQPAPESGATYAQVDAGCCWDWVPRCGYESNGECSSDPEQEPAICIPCGNDVCDVAEDSCNCPEDCGG